MQGEAVSPDCGGRWARNGIGWAATSLIPESLRALAVNLEVWLRNAGFVLEHRAFAPHVTLVRKAQCAPLFDAIRPIAWEVNTFALIHSQLHRGAPRYRTLGAWPLKQGTY